ncbi:hypothetical protein CBR_g39827 [Chara braunii]|uniref:Protein kinase domain-containing protein n=1 Tax=Chara braunii TaxID=69332 RepID=A0A388LSD4_CHABU|nr:hypothetical protein CBR_g39827 [Chara braunii]|eukprot:GBG85260.1 hypothetical protein CBR_g39827 [Chara braunii]
MAAQHFGNMMKLVRELQYGHSFFYTETFDTDNDTWHREDDGHDEVDVVNYFANLCAFHVDEVSGNDEQEEEDVVNGETGELEDDDVVDYFAAINSVCGKRTLESDYLHDEWEYGLGEVGRWNVEWGQKATATLPTTTTTHNDVSKSGMGVQGKRDINNTDNDDEDNNNINNNADADVDDGGDYGNSGAARGEGVNIINNNNNNNNDDEDAARLQWVDHEGATRAPASERVVGACALQVLTMERELPGGAKALTTLERNMVVATVSVVAMRYRIERTTTRLRMRLFIRRQRQLMQQVMDAPDSVSLSESIVQSCCAMASGVIPRATARWWMRRRTGGTWEDLRQVDDAAEGYYKEKLPSGVVNGARRLSAGVFPPVHCRLPHRSSFLSAARTPHDDAHVEQHDKEQEKSGQQQEREPPEDVCHDATCEASLSQTVAANRRNCGELGRLLMMLYPIMRDVQWSHLMDDVHARICIQNLQKALKEAEVLLKRCVYSGPFTWMVHSTRIARELADISCEISHSLHVVQMLVAESNRKQLERLRQDLLDIKYKVNEEDWRLSERLLNVMKKEEEVEATTSQDNPYADKADLQPSSPTSSLGSADGESASGDEALDLEAGSSSPFASACTSPHASASLSVSRLSRSGLLTISTATTATAEGASDDPPSISQVSTHSPGEPSRITNPSLTVELTSTIMDDFSIEDPGGVKEVLREAAHYLGVAEREVLKEYAQVKKQMRHTGLLQALEVDPRSLEFVRLISAGGGRTAGVWAGRLWSKTAGGKLVSREVAVKKFPCFDGVHVTEQFRREVEVLHKASSRCPNVCKLYGVCGKDGHLCIIMKLYKLSLQDIIQKVNGPMNLLDVERRAISMCRALMQLHREHIIVQDVKPANFLEDDDGGLVIADFGISRTVERTNGKYSPTMARGTARYMSPEAWGGEALWAQSDMWSLGCTILNMITGQPPFPGLRETAVGYKVLHEQAKPDIPAGIPQPLRAMLLRCFEYQACDRPQAHELLAFFLRGINCSEPVNAPLTDVFIRRNQKTSNSTKDVKFAGVLSGGSGDLIQLSQLVQVQATAGEATGDPEGEKRCHSSSTFGQQSDRSLLSSAAPTSTKGLRKSRGNSRKTSAATSSLCLGAALSKGPILNGPGGASRSQCFWAALLVIVVIVVSVCITIPVMITVVMHWNAKSIHSPQIPEYFSDKQIDSKIWYSLGHDDKERSDNLMTALKRTRYSVPGIPCLGLAFGGQVHDHIINTLFAFTCSFFGGPLDDPACQYIPPNSTKVANTDRKLVMAMLQTHGRTSGRNIKLGQQEMFVEYLMAAINSVVKTNRTFEDGVQARLQSLDTIIARSANGCPKNAEGKQLLWKRNVSYSTVVHVDETITWVWDDDEPHSVAAGDEEFAEELPEAIGVGNLIVSRAANCTKENLAIVCALKLSESGDTFKFSHTFRTPGNYSYHCGRFQEDMKGHVVVTE